MRGLQEESHRDFSKNLRRIFSRNPESCVVSGHGALHSMNPIKLQIQIKFAHQKGFGEYNNTAPLYSSESLNDR